MPGLIQTIEPESVAAQAGLKPGDMLLSINGLTLRDMIDAQFYGAESELTLTVTRDNQQFDVHAHRDFGQALGLEFAHPTFDIDIRRCNNLCPFCFVLQNAPRMRRSLYIKDDDYRYSFLYGHFVTLTNLSEEDWARIFEQHLSPLYVSVHATDLEVRRKCLRNPTSGDIMAQLGRLAQHDINVHTQLVITPGLNDGAVLEKSVRDLASLYPHVQSVSVVPVGLTQHHKYGHRPHTSAESAAMINTVEAWQKEYRARFGMGFVYLTDEWYLVSQRAVPPKKAYDHLALQENGLGMVRDFLNHWQRLKRTEVTGPLLKPTYKRALLATATLFAPTLAKAAQEFSARTQIPLDVLAIKNEKLGETITIAGLLMGEDIIRQLNARPELLAQAEVVILPRITFDHPDGIALDDLSPANISRAIGKPVALARTMGDVLNIIQAGTMLV
jgi:putative radical SAM enzyme (TIGR03279 family)